MTITWNYVIVECDCERSQIAVVDNNDEDCNLWDRYNVIRNENEVCIGCGKLPAVNVSYAVPPANTAWSRLMVGTGDLPAVANQSESDSPA